MDMSGSLESKKQVAEFVTRYMVIMNKKSRKKKLSIASLGQINSFPRRVKYSACMGYQKERRNLFKELLSFSSAFGMIHTDSVSFHNHRVIIFS